MKDIPLHTSRNPGSEHTHVCGLDDALAIEYLISVGLVRSIEKTATYVRKHTDLDIVILKVECPVSGIHLFDRRVVIHRVRVYTSFCTLIGKVPLEKRRSFRRIHSVGRQVLHSFPHLHRSVLCRSSQSGKQQDNRICLFHFTGDVRFLMQRKDFKQHDFSQKSRLMQDYSQMQ